MDTMDGITHAADTVLVERGWSALGRGFYESAIGGGARALIEKAVTAAGGEEASVDEVLSAFLKAYKSSWSVGLNCYFEMESIVNRLNEEGFTIVVNTNKGHDLAVSVVRSVFSKSVIKDIEGSSSKRPKKPDPAGIDFLLSALGRTRAEAIYIGDSVVDVKTAKQAGIPVIGVAWGYGDAVLLEDADFIVETDDELYHKLQELS